MSPPLGVYVCQRCSSKLELRGSGERSKGLTGWLIQDEKYFCPACRPIVLRPGPTQHVYKFHPDTGQSAHDPIGLPTVEQKQFRDVVSEAVRNGGGYYWHKNQTGWTRVEIVNFKFAYELIGCAVLKHDAFIPEINAGG